MTVATEIAKPDLNKVDPDKDGLPGISIETKEAKRRLSELAKRIAETPINSPDWYDVLYLFLLEYGTNLKYLNPVFAKLGGFGVLVNTGLVLAIKYMAKRSCVKQIDLKDPENL